ncbi:MAG: hypothetical protein AAGI53_12425 [Planctomycetota bacterium]
MRRLLRALNALLKGRSLPTRQTVLIGITFAAAYGLCMSSFGAWSPERAVMPLVGAMKAPLVLALTTLVCVPAFWGLCGATGRSDWFRVALKCVSESQAVGAVALAALGPLVVVGYLAGIGEATALVLNAFAFAIAIAAIAAQRALWTRLRKLMGRGGAPARLLACWFVLYGFVGVQVAWMVRPVIVPRDEPFGLLRDEPLTNGYVAVARVVWAAINDSLGGSVQPRDEADHLEPYL